MINKILFTLVAVGVIISLILSQDKSSIDIENEIQAKQKKEKKIRSEIERLKNEIKENDISTNNKKNSLKEIDKQIKLTEQLLEKIKERERVLSNSMQITENSIKDKEQDMERLRKKYSDMVIYLYKNHRDGKLDVLLNSNSWNDIVYKTKYLEIISEKEENIKISLNTHIASLNNEIIEFVENLDRISREESRKKNKVDSLAEDLAKEEREIKKSEIEKDNLRKKQFNEEKALKDIKKLLEKLYLDKDLAEKRENELKRKREEELRKIKEEEERKKKIIDQKFANNKGRLQWPVSGNVREKQGEYKHRHSDGSIVKGYNKWAKIQTTKNATVKLPFDGIISSIDLLDLYRGVVIVDHGNQYYTVYANLNENLPETLNVGEYYNKDTVIGVVAEGEDEKYGELNFGIWKFSKNNSNPEYLNPEEWIK